MSLNHVQAMFDAIGVPGLGLPTPAQTQAKLLLFQFDTPAATPVAADVSHRRRYTLDVFGEEPVHGRTCTIRVRGSSAVGRPRIFLLGVSWAPQADTSVSRYTAWDAIGTGADKLVKGVILDVDTRGRSRAVQVQGDGTTQATFTCQSSGRRSLHFSWPQFRARMVRLRPTDLLHWRLYSVRWICDEEPLQLTRWETQPQTNGILNWHSMITLHVSYQSDAEVAVTIIAYDREGRPREHHDLLPSTSGAKVVAHVQPVALQGLLYKYLFQSAGGFYIYREESVAFVQEWGAADERRVQPFGNDDLASPSRDMRSASGVVSRQGGGR